MSAIGPKQTWSSAPHMSAFGGKADISDVMYRVISTWLTPEVRPVDALINVVFPVFGIILTGYLAGRFEALGPESAAALNRFVFYFALPCALFIFTARAPSDKIFNWPF